MATRVITGTLKSSGSHTSSRTDSTTASGDVYLAWDTTKITKLSDLKAVLRTILLEAQGELGN